MKVKRKPVNKTKNLYFTGAMILFILAFLPSGAFSGSCIPCGDLEKIDFGPEVTIDSVKLIPATETLPQHCEVKGVRFYDAFIIKLPTDWNGRYYQIGNGGAAGSISESGIDYGLQKGYAAASGSGGHTLNLFPFLLGATHQMTLPHNKKLMIFATGRSTGRQSW